MTGDQNSFTSFHALVAVCLKIVVFIHQFIAGLHWENPAFLQRQYAVGNPANLFRVVRNRQDRAL
jgi:hypothetical protein